jgi:hypothetical protein
MLGKPGGDGCEGDEWAPRMALLGQGRNRNPATNWLPGYFVGCLWAASLPPGGSMLTNLPDSVRFARASSDFSIVW